MIHGGPTKTDPGEDGWSIDPKVIRLRIWATDGGRELPKPEELPASGELIIGSSIAPEPCWLRLADPEKGRVSRRHAALTYERERWILRDLGSKNGIKVDGVVRSETALEPGMEIWIGGVTLVAESASSAALRGFLGRILGWRTSENLAVDVALRAIRAAAARREALVLCGESDLVSVARSLHRRFQQDRPFIVCDRNRKETRENVRSAENFEAGMAALFAAKGGAICVRHDRLPRDFGKVRIALQDPDVRVHLVVCTSKPDDAAKYRTDPIVIPRLETRTDEIVSIVSAYSDEATTEFACPRFARDEQAWVVAEESKTLPQIETATRRLAALRSEDGNITRAAAKLRMARQSLHDWIGRRRLPIPIQHEDK